MKHSIFAILTAFVALVFTSCDKIKGEGPVISQNRITPDFSSLSFSLSGEVNVTQGANFKVEIIAQQNILDVIQTSVVNDELVIKLKNNTVIKSNETIVVNITMPEVKGLKVNGSGNMTTGNIVAGNIAVSINGSGNIHLASLTADQFQATISGSGGIRAMGGNIGSTVLKISGSGDIDLIDVQADSAHTTTSGSGSIRIRVAQTLHVIISGSGSVFYKGTPVVTTNISGSGNIVHLQ